MERFLLSAADQSNLLDEMCVTFGFCSLSDESRKLLASTPLSIDEYTEAVWRSECGDSVVWKHQLGTKAQMRQRVAFYYDRATNHGLWYLQFPNGDSENS